MSDHPLVPAYLPPDFVIVPQRDMHEPGDPAGNRFEACAPADATIFMLLYETTADDLRGPGRRAKLALYIDAYATRDAAIAAARAIAAYEAALRASLPRTRASS